MAGLGVADDHPVHIQSLQPRTAPVTLLQPGPLLFGGLNSGVGVPSLSTSKGESVHRRTQTKVVAIGSYPAAAISPDHGSMNRAG